MGDINNFVEVVIRLQTGGVSRAGFGTILVAGLHTLFSDRVKFYGSLGEMADDGFDGDHGTLKGSIYNAAAAIFAQNPSPNRIAVGRVQTNEVIGTILEAVEGREYKAWLNDVEYSYTALALDDVDNIAAGLAALLNAVSGWTSAGVGSGGEYTLVVDSVGTFFSFYVDDNQTAAPDPSGTQETWTAGLTEIRDASDDWYGLIATTRVKTDQEDVADWVASVDSPKFYRLASADSDIANVVPASDTTSIAAILKAKAYTRAMVIYHTKADGTINDQWIDAAWMAMALGYDPDVETATDKFKTLLGITPDSITATQRGNILGTEENPLAGKNANVYTTVAQRNITQSGMTAGGEWADVIFGADWLKVRTEERIFAAFVNNPKLPYTDAGIAAIVSEIRGQLKKGQDTGYIAFDPQWDETFGYGVSFPLARNVDTADKAARILKNVSFVATLAGAIHAAKPIVGTLSA